MEYIQIVKKPVGITRLVFLFCPGLSFFYHRDDILYIEKTVRNVTY